MKKTIVGLLCFCVMLYASDATALHAEMSELSRSAQIDTSYGRQWMSFSPPGAIDDRLTHATVYDPDGDRIYMIGGTPDGRAHTRLTSVYAYNPTFDFWETNLAPLPDARGWIQGAYWTGKIYIIAGSPISQSSSNTCYIYDIAADSWSNGADITRFTAAHGTVSYNGSIYVVGGVDSSFSQGTTNVTRYDIASDSWSDATPLPEQFYMGGVTILDNRIYIIGGYNRGAGQCWTNVGIGVIEPSDPDSITWSYGVTLPTPVMNNGAAASAIRNRCVILGGFLNASIPTSKFRLYNPGLDAFVWEEDYPLTIARNHYLACCDGGWPGFYCVAGDADGNWNPPNNYYYWTYLMGIEEHNIDVKTKKIGPTIFSGPLLLPMDRECKVFDITGRLVAPDKIKPGIYFVEIDGEISRKVVKVR